MGKLFVTGDVHGNFIRFQNGNFDFTDCRKEDTFIIICGDFGGIFDSKIGMEDPFEANTMNWLASLPVTFVVIGGNHENYDAIYHNYPIQLWHGAQCRLFRHNIVWVERNQIVELNGKKFYCFGGATSTDKIWRTAGESWWHQECATMEEFEEGLATFEARYDEIDYIVTHDAPQQFKVDYSHGLNKWLSTPLYPTANFLDKLTWLNKDEKPHFCGHLHDNVHLENGYNCWLLYADILSIDEDGTIERAYTNIL